MATVAFDTHAFVKKLLRTGVPEEQAEVHAETLAQLIEGDLATKHDLKELEANLKRDIEVLRLETKTMEANLKRDIADIKADMLKWVAGLLAAQAGFIVAAIKL